MNDQYTFSFLESLAVQRRVLFALLMREVITRFGRDNLGVLWLVGEPMLFTIGVTTLWSVAGLAHSSSIPIAAFAVTGYSSVLLWRNAASRCSGAIDQNKQLLYHRDVLLVDVLLMRIVIEVVGATGSFIILSTIFVLLGWMPLPHDMLGVIVGWFMLIWVGMSIALLIGAGTAFSELTERLWHPAAYLLFPLSGAGFMVDWLPPKLQSAVLLLPMVHGLEALREGFFGGVVKTHYNLGYMAEFCAVMTIIGLYLLRVAGKKLEF